MEWFWDNNIGRFLGFSVQKLGAETRRCNFLLMLPVISFPVFPLAVAEIYLERKQWRKPEYLLPLVISLVGIIVLFSSASFRTIYFLPLLPAFALLATQGLIRVPPQSLAVWNLLARICFSVVTLAFWIIWLNLLFPLDHRPVPWLVRRFDHILPPDFVPQGHQWLECSVAIIVALFWLASFRLKANSSLNTARIFFTGAALLWCTSHTLLMPWINETKSFCSAVKKLENFVHDSPYSGQCIANYQLGENMAPMIEYFMQLEKPLAIIDLDSDVCSLFITFSLREAPEDIDPRWKMIWRGTRLHDIKSSELRLYARLKN